MTKISFLFSFLFFSLSFSQTYQFDFLTKYSSTIVKTKSIGESVTYNNSDDFSYYLRLNKTKEDFTASLYDHKRNLEHYFSVIETKVNGEIRFQFKYINSAKLLTSTLMKNYRYEFSEISANDPKVVSLKIYLSKRAKKPISEKEFTLQKANKNLIPLYRSEWLREYSDDGELKKVGNYIVSKAIENYKTVTCEVVLKEYKNVDLQLVVPEKLKM
ncbi:hypothetical protein [Kaistella sp.]|uniref:hypothetical protein n=1 Tax=Kaistella sp. TaxID=2782235 RepID=UPI0035A1B55E